MPRPPNPDLPRQLLDAAAALLDERGDTRFSMRELASRVGYAVTAVYRCFESRSDLLRALQLRLFEELSAELGALAASGDTRERLERIAQRYIAWALAHPARYELMFHSTEPEGSLSQAERELARLGYRAFELMLARGIRRGEVRSGDPSVLAAWLLSVLHGLASLAVTGRLEGTGAEDVEAFLAQHLRPLLTAILAAPSPPDAPAP